MPGARPCRLSRTFRTNWRHAFHAEPRSTLPLIGGSDVCMLAPAAATEAIELSFVVNDGSDVETPRPPSSGNRQTIVPPASATSLSTSAGSEPDVNATVYIEVEVPPTDRVDADAAETNRTATETAAKAAVARTIRPVVAAIRRRRNSWNERAYADRKRRGPASPPALAYSCRSSAASASGR